VWLRSTCLVRERRGFAPGIDMHHNTKPKRSRDGELDWTSLFAAFHDAFEWALDVAAEIARRYPEEVAAVERVRTFMRARIAGEMSHVRVDDLLFAFGLLIAAIERDSHRFQSASQPAA
jgi:hypothetical protein